MADPIPAESTWTYALANFKRTILRECLYSLGTAPLPTVDAETAARQITVDGELIDNYRAIVEAKRIVRVRDYLADKENFSELAVLTVVFDRFDVQLLYDCLGKPLGFGWEGQGTRDQEDVRSPKQHNQQLR